MRNVTAASLSLVLLLLVARPAPATDGVPADALLVEVIRRSDFDELVGQIAARDAPLGSSAAEVARALFAPSVGFPRRERETLLLLLVRTTDDPDARRDLADTLFARLDDIEDWSLLAMLFEQGVRSRTGTLVDALDAALRILAALEEPSSRRAGYERAAIAVARHAQTLAEAADRPADGAQEVRRGDARTDDARGVAARSALPLAETLRAIARLSRSVEVVDAARASARALLAASR